MARKFLSTDVITKISPANPRRIGSRGHQLWELLRPGMTVGEAERDWQALVSKMSPDKAKTAGTVRLHLGWDVDHGDLCIAPAEQVSLPEDEAVTPNVEHQEIAVLVASLLVSGRQLFRLLTKSA